MHHRTNSTQDIELFPFLSVLFCTIGTLILIVILMVVQASASNKKVKIVARDGSVSVSKIPRYIECQSEGVVIHPSKQFISVEDLDNAYSPFNDYLDEVEQANEYLIVAIRPDGVEVFQTVREIAESKGIDLGYEPFDADWELNLTQPTTER